MTSAADSVAQSPLGLSRWNGTAIRPESVGLRVIEPYTHRRFARLIPRIVDPVEVERFADANLRTGALVSNRYRLYRN